MANEDYSHVSSTLIKQIARFGGDDAGTGAAARATLRDSGPDNAAKRLPWGRLPWGRLAWFGEERKARALTALPSRH